ncbi:transglutaminase-like domain-containing protein, partial [Arsukibacterium sp.]|uniref:transglutaminase-like domain-containing protein n=1 Tax=Arsukibacterium sp. TaxID=1977258 RepID=UPI002FD8B347
AAIANYFANEPFYYSLQPPLLGANSVDQFLFDSRIGFCSHYASATAVMLRAAGIPARVVGGYQGGEWQEAQNYLMVRQRDAHAWVEYLDNGLWQRFDPTAVIAPQRVLQGLDQSLSAAEQALLQGWQPNWWRQVSLQLMHLDYYWSVWVLGFNEQKQLSLWQSLSDWLKQWRQWPVLRIVIVLLAVGIAVFGAILAWRWQQRRHWPLSVRARHMIRRQLKLPMAADGQSLSAQLQQWQQQLAQSQPAVASWLEQLRQHYEKLVYAADSSAFSVIVTLLHQAPKNLSGSRRRIENS